MAPEPTEAKEPNNYRHTLTSSRATVVSCAQNVSDGSGSPLDAIAGPLASGGWECTEADNWIADLRGNCAGIRAAFDEAVIAIDGVIKAEPDEVPEKDWRGLAWNRTWSQRRRLGGL